MAHAHAVPSRAADIVPQNDLYTSAALVVDADCGHLEVCEGPGLG